MSSLFNWDIHTVPKAFEEVDLYPASTPEKHHGPDMARQSLQREVLTSGNRKRGGQKLHYKDGLKRHLKAADMDVDTWESDAKNRSSWRKKIIDAGNTIERKRKEKYLEGWRKRHPRDPTYNSLHRNRWAADDDDMSSFLFQNMHYSAISLGVHQCSHVVQYYRLSKAKGTFFVTHSSESFASYLSLHWSWYWETLAVKLHNFWGPKINKRWSILLPDVWLLWNLQSSLLISYSDTAGCHWWMFSWYSIGRCKLALFIFWYKKIFIGLKNGSLLHTCTQTGSLSMQFCKQCSDHLHWPPRGRGELQPTFKL